MHSRIQHKILSAVMALFFVASACSLPTMQQPSRPATPSAPPSGPQATLDALMTKVPGVMTATPGVVMAPTNTLAAPTLAASATPLPTFTRVVLPTNTQTPVCDRAGFIGDVTVPDGATVTAGQNFNKTWRIRNLGSCTWTPEYAVVFDAGTGSGMSATSPLRLGVSVAPGQDVDITLPMKAPGAPGSYRDYWKLRNAAGVTFGLGAANERFYVDIKVVSAPASGAGFDFSANACLAQWTGGSKSLPCLGKEGDADGFVLYRSKPTLESGYIDDEPGLVTNPPAVSDGVIRGRFPAYTVRDKDHFYAILSCEFNAKKCNVRFQLDYQIDNGAIQTLGAWNEAYEGGFTQVNVDLSGLAGKNVSFILTAMANGASDQDRALWLLPRIAQAPATATPTATATATVKPPATATATQEVTEEPTATETVEAYPYP